MNHGNRLLVIADNTPERVALDALLAPLPYDVTYVESGLAAVEVAAVAGPDLIVLDSAVARNHPDEDGFSVCRAIRVHPMLFDVPVVMLVSAGDHTTRVQARRVGVDDFLTTPLDWVEVEARLHTIMRLRRYRSSTDTGTMFERVFALAPDAALIVDDRAAIVRANGALLQILGGDERDQERIVGESLLSFVVTEPGEQPMTRFQQLVEQCSQGVPAEIELVQFDGQRVPVEVMSSYIIWDSTPAAQLRFRDMRTRIALTEQLEQSGNTLALAYDATLAAMVRALDVRHRETEGHTRRVTEMTMRLARAVGVTGEELVHIRRGALLHDVGKLCIPDTILFKTGSLTEEEWAIIRQHPTCAYEWLSAVAYLRPALDIPYCHHERWDGGGYPRGLRGTDIPLAARMFAVVDVWESLRSRRPYRDAWGEDHVRAHIRAQSGSHFEPRMVEAFLALYCPFDTSEG
jgi:PAS domain S-box-containing protein